MASSSRLPLMHGNPRNNIQAPDSSSQPTKIPKSCVFFSPKPPPRRSDLAYDVRPVSIAHPIEASFTDQSSSQRSTLGNIREDSLSSVFPD
ncbi:hypothetical protein CCUS01_12685 [Colletotrichum cuscutae]|uniref:Uncharacterized protein n=1 Tax=Colletotrichum cuscutae TaxID=1209917 RepID=A0AAI9TTU7_9PEZI|nr:hypothetical protein CCUS01_12685 [Colletotrichum cuscutae]